MKIVLELQDQPSNIKKVTVRHDIVIGRGSDCNLRLSSPQVSRRHCFLRIGAEGASISDLDSSNGTMLNGKKLSSGKRYAIPNGALIAVGPIQFVAHVESEIPVAEVLEVGVSGGQLVADSVTDSNGSELGGDVDATIAGTPPQLNDEESMNFAVEQGGLAAREDEPTADCVVADPAGIVEEEIVLVVDAVEPAAKDENILGDLPNFEEEPIAEAEVVEVSSEIVALSDEAIEIVEVAEVEELIEGEEVVDIIEEVEEVVDEAELIDDEFIEVAEDELIEVIEEVDGEVLEVIEEEEVLLLDDESIIEVVDEVDEASEEVLTLDAPADSVVRGDCVENELKDFLQGPD